MADTDAKPERQPYSIERVETELAAIKSGLLDNIWLHLKCLGDLTGAPFDQHPIGPKSSPDPPKVPMERVFEELHDIKEIVNQFDIHLNNLAHDLHPTYYDTIAKSPG